MTNHHNNHRNGPALVQALPNEVTHHAHAEARRSSLPQVSSPSSADISCECDREAVDAILSLRRQDKKETVSTSVKEKKAPLEPRVIQILKTPRNVMNHSYRDFSSIPAEENEVIPTRIEEMSFPQKVHHILSQDCYKDWIHWMPHGRAFLIVRPKCLEEYRVLEKYFGHNRYSSFLRTMSNHRFKHISHGKDRNCYYHESMLRGLPHLCKNMPPPIDSRRLIPDPEHEIDFYELSKKYPLPDDLDFGKSSNDGEQASITHEDESSCNPQGECQSSPAVLPQAVSGTSSPVPEYVVESITPPPLTRLASETDWAEEQMRPAKRQAVTPNRDDSLRVLEALLEQVVSGRQAVVQQAPRYQPAPIPAPTVANNVAVPSLSESLIEFMTLQRLVSENSRRMSASQISSTLDIPVLPRVLVNSLPLRSQPLPDIIPPSCNSSNSSNSLTVSVLAALLCSAACQASNQR